MPGLSDSQQRIVEYARFDEHMLVIAPPGSGKTHTITQRIAWLLENGRAEPDQILALTYTNKAGRDLRDRIAQQANPHVRACTLHSWAYDFLREHGHEIGISDAFQVCDDFRREEVLRTAALVAGIPMLRPEQLRNVGYWLSQRKCDPNGVPQQQPPFAPQIMAAIEASYESQMRDQRLLDFDDLIIRSADLLWGNAEVAATLHRRLTFIFVDEYHDLSLEQYRLLSAIAPGRLPGRQVLAVADPNQAIFGFRGADAEEMLRRFRADYHPRIFELDLNFRSGARLVRSSNQLINAGEARVESRPARAESDAPSVRTFSTDVREAELIAEAIQNAKQSERWDYRDFAIIYRRHRRADLTEQTLLQRDIPVARIQPNRFFDDRLVIEGFRYLQLVAALDDHCFEPAVNWPRVLVDELTMTQLRVAARAHGLGLTELAQHPELLRSVITPLGAQGIERFLDAIRADVGSVDTARQGIERVLPLVRRRRDPIPSGERANYASTLRELARAVDSVADTLFDAVREGYRVRIQLDEDDPDHLIAAYILKRTLELGFGSEVDLGATSLDRSAFDFSLFDLDARAGHFTCAALAYRLCQRLDERFDRSRHQRFVVFDLETTSTHVGSAELLQIGAVVVENGRVTEERFSTFVRPSGPDAIAIEVERLTGIGWDDVREGSPPAQALKDFLDFAGDAPLVGHNIDGFDLPLIRRLCQQLGLDAPGPFSIDTMKIWRRLNPGSSWALEAALTREERASRREHRADLDARLTARVFIDLMIEIGRERRIGLLGEELPLVAAASASKGRQDPDNALLKAVGRRAMQLGQGISLASIAAQMLLPGRLESAAQALEAVELVADPDDAHWNLVEQQWIDALCTYERTHADQTLQGFVRWFQLAVSTDVEHDDANRVAMMSIHAAKGNEWPVVIMLGAEDDQYVFPFEPDVEEARRHFYVGMTRAREMLIVTHALRVGDQERKPSRFLAEMDVPD